MPPLNKLKARCNTCQSETWHDVLFEKEDKGTDQIDDEFSVSWETMWHVIQCRGCESVSLKSDFTHSEFFDEKGNPEVSTTYFPPRTFRQFPTWLESNPLEESVPAEVEALMKELYIALQNDCRAAAAMLVRAVFERTMIDKCGDQGSFKENLRKFEELGFIGKKHAEVVASMLEAGHASIHRAFIPEKSDTVTLVDILEGILKPIYVHVPKADGLKSRIPKRK